MSINSVLMYINNVWNAYPTEFILLVITAMYTLIRTINDFLPTSLKINKKYKFWRKVKNTVCSVNVSIFINHIMEPAGLMNKFNGFWSKTTRVVRRESGLIIFQSYTTGATYTVQLNESDSPKRSIITIQTSNGFTTGKFGRIKNLDSCLNECQKITNIFTKDKFQTESIITEIKMNPRKEESNKLQQKEVISFTKGNHTYTCTDKIIKISSRGIPDLSQIVKDALTSWMEYFI